MTREHKLALVVGFGLVLFVGILIADHLAAGRRGGGPPALTLLDTPYTLESTTDPQDLVLAPLARPHTTPPRMERQAPPEGVIDFDRREAQPRAFDRREAQPRPRYEVRTGFGGHPTPTSETQWHVVKSGERLEDIAQKYYGDRGLWKMIAEANDISRPERLRAGDRIKIPARRLATDAPRRREPSQTRNYTVKSGDTLTSIAERQLGKQSRWREIQRLNGMRDALIVPGQELKLPTH